ncbi:hypothetical protein LOD99_5632 [Oopsacas minuta]|uniref:Uncharacterized protein n=1 Tax=Oopsacas minuta TaxID=111878 RepID=A0AAV7JRK9_9METZ|nr:hypothetical protein LOD99_5632 [Oopsacas minuta]
MTFQIHHFVYDILHYWLKRKTKRTSNIYWDSIVNSEVNSITQEGILLPKGFVNVTFHRTMIDGKMLGILSRAGDAHCQLCTANKSELKDLEIVRSGFPINRSITTAKEIFSIVDEEEYFLLPFIQHHGLTHPPLSSIDIIPASPLHTFVSFIGT